jgi:hypothetical protein
MLVLDTDTLIFYFKGLHGVPGRLLATPPGDIGTREFSRILGLKVDNWCDDALNG